MACRRVPSIDQQAAQNPEPHLDLQLALAANRNVDMKIRNVEDGVDLHGWVHLAMPQNNQPIDQELHIGNFLALNDLMAPRRCGTSC